NAGTSSACSKPWAGARRPPPRFWVWTERRSTASWSDRDPAPADQLRPIRVHWRAAFLPMGQDAPMHPGPGPSQSAADPHAILQTPPLPAFELRFSCDGAAERSGTPIAELPPTLVRPITR